MAKKKTSSSLAVPYEDSDWRARDDMRTLASAEEIRSDKGRLTAAQKHAAKEAERMSRVVSMPHRGQRASSNKQRLHNKKI